MKDRESIERERDELIASLKTIILSTKDDQGRPEASYAPFRRTGSGNFDVLVSTVAPHGKNLLSGRTVSALLIADESMCKQLYARPRLTLQAQPHRMERGSGEWTKGINALRERFGKIVDQLSEFSDFHLIRLIPLYGRLILGFGRAYDWTGPQMELVRQRSGGHTREGDSQLTNHRD